ncbi:MAG: flagellar export chaperone FliS [Kiritimatiellae bacterium]|nr:flagellar export chaperone FliS [Kiritimatiellia bacterium]MDD4734542.1 flagellar export chaperone FliS [Kiritimatiellia bacterium]
MATATMYQTNTYQQTDVMTASPMQLVLMLYEECIRSLEKAEKAFRQEDPARIEIIGKNLLHAQDVITELAISLDMENGGEIAENLHRLYDFTLSHLSTANVQQKLQPVRDVIVIMTELKEAWTEVAKQEPVRVETARPVEHGSFHITG